MRAPQAVDGPPWYGFGSAHMQLHKMLHTLRPISAGKRGASRAGDDVRQLVSGAPHSLRGARKTNT
jgi:hypothetical protein